MAVSHSGKVGQWAKQNAIDLQRRTILVVFLVVFASVGTLGFLAGLTLHGGYLALIACVVILVGVFGFKKLTRTMDGIFEANAKRRLQYLRGGQAEAWVSILLRKDLGNQWHLFDNLMLDLASDIDHVLIGPGGFFVISTKSQRGLFQANRENSAPQGNPTFNLKPCPWVQDAIRQAMRLKDQLAVIETTKQPWVQPILALPFAHIDTPDRNSETQAPRSGKCWVLHEDNLIDFIEPEPIPKARRLSKADVACWVTALKELQARYEKETTI